jgi:hypothetical protein
MNDTHDPQSRVNTNYLPLVETDIEKSGDPSPPQSTRR